MATTVTTGGANYSVPAYNDTGWAQGVGNLSSYLIALASTKLDISGGSFTLTSPVNFGSTYGVFAAYLTSATANPATAGVLRLALADEVCWGTSNLALSVTGTRLYFNGNELALASDLPTDITENRHVVIATAGQTLINGFGTYVANGVNLNVYVNGLVQDVTYDYAETSTTIITFNAGLNAGDRVSLRWVTY